MNGFMETCSNDQLHSRQVIHTYKYIPVDPCPGGPVDLLLDRLETDKPLPGVTPPGQGWGDVMDPFCPTVCP